MRFSLFDGNLLYFSTMVGRNYSTEITLFQKGGSPFSFSACLELNQKIDHTPQFRLEFSLFGWTVVDYSFHNIHHAINEVDEELGIVWEWVEKDRTWYAKFPVEVNGVKGEWLVWLTQRPHYCDRGRWGVGVDGVGCSPPDEQEGFPRYFFDLETAKEEMRAWVKMRQEIIKKKA